MHTKELTNPMHVQPLQALPENMDAFVEEVARGIRDLYGAPAEHQYRTLARRSLVATLKHPSVWACGVCEGEDTLAYVLVTIREEAAQVHFMHVLAPYVGQGLESLLFDAAIEAAHRHGVRHILCEMVNFSPFDLKKNAERQGFRHVARSIMLAKSAMVPRASAALGLPMQTVDPAEWESGARCLVAAYANEPGRDLHIEVHDRHRALAFISRVAAGNYGRTQSSYMLAAMDGPVCAGLVLGSEVSPDTGFVLQVVVDPAYRGQGIASRLLGRLCATFADGGKVQVGLGVTNDNPARRLYERLGFHVVHPIDAYVWWADQTSDSSTAM